MSLSGESQRATLAIPSTWKYPDIVPEPQKLQPGNEEFVADWGFFSSLLVQFRLSPHGHKRKNALFAGADSGGRHWAMIASLIQTAKLNDVEPQAWLTDVLERIVSGRTKRNAMETLLPWNWAAEQSPLADTA
jgi:hypothetical protein